MEQRLVKIGEAARILGTTPGQLRKWEASGELLPTRKTRGGTRYYATPEPLGHQAAVADPLTVCYARVSSRDQNADLDRQHADLEAYCAMRGWRTQVTRDMGSGMNYREKGLLELIMHRRAERLVVTHKGRLLRFGVELLFSLCELPGIEVVIIHQGEQPGFEEEMAQDVLEIITVFSARLYGARIHKSQRLLDAVAGDGEETVIETARQLSLLGYP